MDEQLDQFHQEAGEVGIPDPREAHAPHKEHPSAKAYVRIGIVLCALTGLEVWLSYSGISGTALITLLLATAGLKFVLVVTWFMHLRFDDPRYSRFFVMGIAGAVTLYLVVLMIFGVFGDS